MVSVWEIWAIDLLSPELGHFASKVKSNDDLRQEETTSGVHSWWPWSDPQLGFGPTGSGLHQVRSSWDLGAPFAADSRLLFIWDEKAWFPFEMLDCAY